LASWADFCSRINALAVCNIYRSLVSHYLLRVSVRFWGWSENKREEQMDFEELSQRAKEGKPLYGDSPQPAWVQGSAYRNSAYSQLKFCTLSFSPSFLVLNASSVSCVSNVRSSYPILLLINLLP
jgi:hypothetical protein